MASQDAMLLQAQGLNQNLASLVQVMRTRFALSSTTGTFALAAAANTTVNDTNIKANSLVVLVPNTAAAATVMGSAKSLYVSAKVAGTSFTVTTADGTAVAGGQSFSYILLTVG